MFSSFPIAVFAKNKTVNKITTGIFCCTPSYLNKGQGANIHFMLKLSLAVNFLAEAKRNKLIERIQEYAFESAIFEFIDRSLNLLNNDWIAK